MISERAPAGESPEDKEALYRHAREALGSPQPARPMNGVFIVLLILFVASQFRESTSILDIAALLLVISFHEAGHALGMRLFGFRDVRMFFIPFLGAAVSGRQRGAAAWKEALVSLLGPLPGLVMGVVGLWLLRDHSSRALTSVVEMLLILNLLNLLPFGPLDGGQFMARVVFSRHPVLDVGFRAAGAVLLIAISLYSSLFFVAAFAAYWLYLLRDRWRLVSAAAAVRARFPSLVANPERLSEAEARAVFARARELLRSPRRDSPAAIARRMESLIDAMVRAPGVFASAGLLWLYVCGCVLGLVGTFYLVEETRPASWTFVEQPEWRAEFPRNPWLRTSDDLDSEPSVTWPAAIEGAERFSLTTYSARRVMSDDAWRDELCERVARDTGSVIILARRIDLAGKVAGECELRKPNGRVTRARSLITQTERYALVTSAPHWGDNQQRFFDSFELLGDRARDQR
jgi:Zn-dependent protease